MLSEIRPYCGLQKHVSVFTRQIVNKLLKASFTNERQPALSTSDSARYIRTLL